MLVIPLAYKIPSHAFLLFFGCFWEQDSVVPWLSPFFSKTDNFCSQLHLGISKEVGSYLLCWANSARWNTWWLYCWRAIEAGSYLLVLGIRLYWFCRFNCHIASFYFEHFINCSSSNSSHYNHYLKCLIPEDLPRPIEEAKPIPLKEICLPGLRVSSPFKRKLIILLDPSSTTLRWFLFSWPTNWHNHCKKFRNLSYEEFEGINSHVAYFIGLIRVPGLLLMRQILWYSLSGLLPPPESLTIGRTSAKPSSPK